MTGTVDLEEMRRRYVADQVLTAVPAQRLMMLLDRLLWDMGRAAAAFERSAIEEIHGHLLHAQEILLALRAPLATSDWEGAAQLHSLYLFVYQRLVRCNLRKDRSLLPACIEIIDRIREANGTALEQHGASTTTSGVG